nr:response regulator transcription factor [Rhodococcus sp. (in: high G+C Gram-positive bacteria)]
MTPHPVSPIRVVLADDHTLFRAGLAALIETDPAFTVVADCPDGTTAIDVITAVVPDIAVLDIEMPGPGIHAVIGALRTRAPSVRIVVLSMHEDSAVVQELLTAGASAFLAKTVARDQLIAGLHAVNRSQETVLISTSRVAFGTPERPESPLSPRETEVVRLVADGLSNRQIGRKLGITEATVKRHLTNVYAKLGAVSRVDCLRKAAEYGVTNYW